MAGKSGFSAALKVEFRNDAFASLDADLQKIPNHLVRGKIQERALRDAAKVALEGAKRRVPVKTGELRKSLSIATPRLGGAKQNLIGADIHAKRSAQTPGGYYAHLVEYGHRVFKTTRTRRIELRSAPARPFMLPTLEQDTQAIIDAYAARVGAELKKLEGK